MKGSEMRQFARYRETKARLEKTGKKELEIEQRYHHETCTALKGIT